MQSVNRNNLCQAARELHVRPPLLGFGRHSPSLLVPGAPWLDVVQIRHEPLPPLLEPDESEDDAPPAEQRVPQPQPLPLLLASYVPGDRDPAPQPPRQFNVAAASTGAAAAAQAAVDAARHVEASLGGRNGGTDPRGGEGGARLGHGDERGGGRPSQGARLLERVAHALRHPRPTFCPRVASARSPPGPRPQARTRARPRSGLRPVSVPANYRLRTRLIRRRMGSARVCGGCERRHRTHRSYSGNFNWIMTGVTSFWNRLDSSLQPRAHLQAMLSNVHQFVLGYLSRLPDALTYAADRLAEDPNFQMATLPLVPVRDHVVELKPPSPDSSATQRSSPHRRIQTRRHKQHQSTWDCPSLSPPSSPSMSPPAESPTVASSPSAPSFQALQSSLSTPSTPMICSPQKSPQTPDVPSPPLASSPSRAPLVETLQPPRPRRHHARQRSKPTPSPPRAERASPCRVRCSACRKSARKSDRKSPHRSAHRSGYRRAGGCSGVSARRLFLIQKHLVAMQERRERLRQREISRQQSRRAFSALPDSNPDALNLELLDEGKPTSALMRILKQFSSHPSHSSVRHLLTSPSHKKSKKKSVHKKKKQSESMTSTREIATSPLPLTRPYCAVCDLEFATTDRSQKGVSSLPKLTRKQTDGSLGSNLGPENNLDNKTFKALSDTFCHSPIPKHRVNGNISHLPVSSDKNRKVVSNLNAKTSNSKMRTEVEKLIDNSREASKSIDDSISNTFSKTINVLGAVLVVGATESNVGNEGARELTRTAAECLLKQSTVRDLSKNNFGIQLEGMNIIQYPNPLNVDQTHNTVNVRATNTPNKSTEAFTSNVGIGKKLTTSPSTPYALHHPNNPSIASIDMIHGESIVFTDSADSESNSFLKKRRGHLNMHPYDYSERNNEINKNLYSLDVPRNKISNLSYSNLIDHTKSRITNNAYQSRGRQTNYSNPDFVIHNNSEMCVLNRISNVSRSLKEINKNTRNLEVHRSIESIIPSHPPHGQNQKHVKSQVSETHSNVRFHTVPSSPGENQIPLQIHGIKRKHSRVGNFDKENSLSLYTPANKHYHGAKAIDIGKSLSSNTFNCVTPNIRHKYPACKRMKHEIYKHNHEHNANSYNEIHLCQSEDSNTPITFTDLQADSKESIHYSPIEYTDLRNKNNDKYSRLKNQCNFKCNSEYNILKSPSLPISCVNKKQVDLMTTKSYDLVSTRTIDAEQSWETHRYNTEDNIYFPDNKSRSPTSVLYSGRTYIIGTKSNEHVRFKASNCEENACKQEYQLRPKVYGYSSTNIPKSPSKILSDSNEFYKYKNKLQRSLSSGGKIRRTNHQEEEFVNTFVSPGKKVLPESFDGETPGKTQFPSYRYSKKMRTMSPTVRYDSPVKRKVTFRQNLVNMSSIDRQTFNSSNSSSSLDVYPNVLDSTRYFKSFVRLPQNHPPTNQTSNITLHSLERSRANSDTATCMFKSMHVPQEAYQQRSITCLIVAPDTPPCLPSTPSPSILKQRMVRSPEPSGEITLTHSPSSSLYPNSTLPSSLVRTPTPSIVSSRGSPQRVFIENSQAADLSLCGLPSTLSHRARNVNNTLDDDPRILGYVPDESCFLPYVPLEETCETLHKDSSVQNLSYFTADWPAGSQVVSDSNLSSSVCFDQYYSFSNELRENSSYATSVFQTDNLKATASPKKTPNNTSLPTEIRHTNLSPISENTLEHARSSLQIRSQCNNLEENEVTTSSASEMTGDSCLASQQIAKQSYSSCTNTEILGKTFTVHANTDDATTVDKLNDVSCESNGSLVETPAASCVADELPEDPPSRYTNAEGEPMTLVEISSRPDIPESVMREVCVRRDDTDYKMLVSCLDRHSALLHEIGLGRGIENLPERVPVASYGDRRISRQEYMESLRQHLQLVRAVCPRLPDETPGDRPSMAALLLL